MFAPLHSVTRLLFEIGGIELYLPMWRVPAVIALPRLFTFPLPSFARTSSLPYDAATAFADCFVRSHEIATLRHLGRRWCSGVTGTARATRTLTVTADLTRVGGFPVDGAAPFKLRYACDCFGNSVFACSAASVSMPDSAMGVPYVRYNALSVRTCVACVCYYSLL